MGLDGACPLIYGPVDSRRHGRSLGINLGNPRQKICSWGCLYCQCGHGERRELRTEDGLPSVDQVLSELRDGLLTCGPIDSVTFAGNSEPGAHPLFLEIVRGVFELRNELSAAWVVNCLSNGSELWREEVVEACNLLDEAWLKLDCGTDDLFKRLNRPIRQVGGVAEHLSRIKKLREVRIQSLFWNSAEGSKATNWSETNRSALRTAFQFLSPVQVHLTTVSRDPAWRGALPVPSSELDEYAHELRDLGIDAETFP